MTFNMRYLMLRFVGKKSEANMTVDHIILLFD